MKYYATIRILIAFAAGTLIADALIHMIPECFHEIIEGGGDDEPHQNILWVSFYIFVGFTLFLLIEKILNLTGISHHHDMLE